MRFVSPLAAGVAMSGGSGIVRTGAAARYGRRRRDCAGAASLGASASAADVGRVAAATDHRIVLDESLSSVMRSVGLHVTGGQRDDTGRPTASRTEAPPGRSSRVRPPGSGRSPRFDPCRPAVLHRPERRCPAAVDRRVLVRVGRLRGRLGHRMTGPDRSVLPAGDDHLSGRTRSRSPLSCNDSRPSSAPWTPPWCSRWSGTHVPGSTATGPR